MVTEKYISNFNKNFRVTLRTIKVPDFPDDNHSPTDFIRYLKEHDVGVLWYDGKQVQFELPDIIGK